MVAGGAGPDSEGIGNLAVPVPSAMRFAPTPCFDLRGLNEKVAGQSGFVRLAPDGESFVLGDGTPARFWGVTTYVQRDRSIEDLAHHARFLAKRGVNMVRLHGHLDPKDKNARVTDVDEKAIDEAWKLVAAMKKEGIYVTISPYWSANVKHVPAQWGLEGWPENEAPFGLLFFNPKLQEGYKAWLKALLTRPNPYTGIPLAKDPALAIIQLQNEDSLLFWTAQNIKGKQAELLGRQFGDWLKAKYGSLAAAFKAWGNDRVPEDRPAEGVVGLLLVWEWTQPREGGRKRRLDDQLQFYAETMYRFNREMRALPARRPGLQATGQRRQLADGRRRQARRRRALVVHGQRGDRGQPLLQPGSHRSRPRLADRPRRFFRGRVGFASAARVAAEPQAGRRAPDDGDREPLGAAAGLSIGGAVPGGGLSVAHRRGCLLLVRDRRDRVVEPGSGGLGLGFESQVGDREPDGPGPVSRGGAVVPQGLSQARRAGRRGAPLAGPDLGAGAAGPRRRAGLRPQPRLGRHGPPVERGRGTAIRSRSWSVR